MARVGSEGQTWIKGTDLDQRDRPGSEGQTWIKGSDPLIHELEGIPEAEGYAEGIIIELAAVGIKAVEKIECAAM